MGLNTLWQHGLASRPDIYEMASSHRDYLPPTDRIGLTVTPIVDEDLRPVVGLDDALEVGQEGPRPSPRSRRTRRDTQAPTARHITPIKRSFGVEPIMVCCFVIFTAPREKWENRRETCGRVERGVVG
jgi:hypothetical protein